MTGPSPIRSRASSRIPVELTAEQEQEAGEIFEVVQGAFSDELHYLSQLMASKQTGEIFGPAEFQVRDRVHALGATLLEAAAAVRIKKGVPGS